MRNVISKKFLYHNRRQIYIGFILLLLPFLMVNVPYLNVIFLGFEEKVSYLWVVILLVLKPSLHKIFYITIALLIIHIISLIFYDGYGSEALGIYLYITFVYLSIKFFINLKRGELVEAEL